MGDELRILLSVGTIELNCRRNHLGHPCGAMMRIPVRALGQFDVRCPGCGWNHRQETLQQVRANLDELKRLAKRLLNPEFEATLEILPGEEKKPPQRVFTKADLERSSGLQ